MKSIINKILVFSLALGLLMSCDEEKFLEEVPLDFYSPENAFNSVSGYEASLTDLYAKEREVYFGGGDINYSLLFGTDMFLHARGNDGSREKISNLQNSLGAQTFLSQYYWDKNYKIVSGANFIISNSAKSTLSDADKLRLVSEAKLFRAKAFRDLVYLFGGVPLTLEPVTEPKADYVRATKEEVLNQMVADLTDAAANLPSISTVKDGRVSNVVAYHYLAETLLSLGRKTEALAAISMVINDPNVKLMTTRFGRRSTEFGKDPYFDLFVRGNQNRAIGNKESLWVAQMQEDIPGGYLKTTSRGPNVLERMHVPAVWSLTDHQSKAGFLGRRGNENVGGFGVSFLQPTPYLNTTIWPVGYASDLRCNNVNFIKDAIYDNPASAAFGKSIKDPAFRAKNWGTTIAAGSWRFYPWFVKATTPNDYPAGILDPSHVTGFNQANSGTTFKDMYILRAAESYLLRAEINLAIGDLGSAAADINAVRARALATPCTAGEVTLDYILDERARELMLEEQRTITMRRVGKYGERITKYNPMSAPSLLPAHELWPIPQSAIQANIGAVLAQNPGY